jgi:hypothetical protein
MCKYFGISWWNKTRNRDDGDGHGLGRREAIAYTYMFIGNFNTW